MKKALGVLTALWLAGCGGGMFPNNQAHEQAAFRSVSQRVSFDLGCDRPSLVRLGDVNRLGQQMTATTIGARCPNQRATYVVTCVSNWGNITCTPEMNTTSGGSAPAR